MYKKYFSRSFSNKEIPYDKIICTLLSAITYFQQWKQQIDCQHFVCEGIYQNTLFLLIVFQSVTNARCYITQRYSENLDCMIYILLKDDFSKAFFFFSPHKLSFSYCFFSKQWQQNVHKTITLSIQDLRFLELFGRHDGGTGLL